MLKFSWSCTLVIWRSNVFLKTWVYHTNSMKIKIWSVHLSFVIYLLPWNPSFINTKLKALALQAAGWVDCMDAGGRVMQEQLPRGESNNSLLQRFLFFSFKDKRIYDYKQATGWRKVMTKTKLNLKTWDFKWEGLLAATALNFISVAAWRPLLPIKITAFPLCLYLTCGL